MQCYKMKSYEKNFYYEYGEDDGGGEEKGGKNAHLFNFAFLKI